jgi:hypothetical protein
VNVGDIITGRHGANCVEGVITHIEGPGDTARVEYVITEEQPNARRGRRVGDVVTSSDAYLINKYYTVTAPQSAERATPEKTESNMHTTTITITKTETTEHTFRFAVGDVVDSGWNKYEITGRKLTAGGEERYTARHCGTNKTYDGRWFSMKDCQVVKRAGLTETVETEVETTEEVETMWLVGDEVKTSYRTYRIEEISKQGARLTRLDKGTDLGWFPLPNCGMVNGTLVGGPRYVEPTPEPTRLLETLKVARGLIATPETWTKHTSKMERDNGVVAYCATGALYEACDDGGGDLYGVAFEAIQKAIGEGADVVGFNDRGNTKHEHVLAAFDKAIADLTLAEVLS